MSEHVKLYFIGSGMNMSRCVGGPEARDLRGVRDAHIFELPEGMTKRDCLAKSPRQILDMGARIIDPLMEPWEEGD